MRDTKAQRPAKALNDFIPSSSDAAAAAVVGFGGLVMASPLEPDTDEDRLGAMPAALPSLREQAPAVSPPWSCGPPPPLSTTRNW
jgi:predicted regulator of Ras-like GTPase activity (Roadblock/LC7/MglB family)